jgi:hypothetical protein
VSEVIQSVRPNYKPNNISELSTAKPDVVVAHHAGIAPRACRGKPRRNPDKMALTEIRSLARTYTRSAIRTLVTVMCHPKTSAAAKVAAANSLLDRGWGKATQPIGNSEDGVLELIHRIERVIVHPENPHS